MPIDDDYRDKDPSRNRRREQARIDEEEERAPRYATVERVKEMIEFYVPKIARAEVITALQAVSINLATFESTAISRSAIEWAMEGVITQNMRKKERYKAVLLGIASLAAAAALPLVIWITTIYKKS